MNLSNYRGEQDKFESMYTLVVYDQSGQELIDELFQRLERLKKMGDAFKRKYLNNRIYSLIERLKLDFQEEPQMKHVILLGPEIHLLPLTRKQLHLLREFQVPTIILERDNSFKIDYLEDLLNNTDYYEVIQVKNNQLKHIQMTPTKRRVVSTHEEKSLKVEEHLPPSDPSRLLIHGVSSALKNLKPKCLFVKKHLTDEEILREFQLEEQRKIYRRLLEEVFVPLQRGGDSCKVVVGKDLVKGIQEMRVQKVFATPKKMVKLRDTFEADLLNFELIEVQKLPPGEEERLEMEDVGAKLARDYAGLIGVTYW